MAYAVQLIDPEAPSFDHVMRRIAYKHVSLGIRSEQYAQDTLCARSSDPISGPLNSHRPIPEPDNRRQAQCLGLDQPTAVVERVRFDP